MRGVVGDTWWASVVFGVAHGCHEDTGRATPRPSNPLHTTPNPENHPMGVGCFRCCTRVPRGHRQSHPTAIQPTSHDPQPRKPPHRTPPHPKHTPVPDALTHHNLNTEADRSRRGVRPISSRNRTDLDAESDRSRRGLARGAGCGRAPASISSEASREPVRRRLRKSSGRAGRCPYAAQPCGRPRRSHR